MSWERRLRDMILAGAAVGSVAAVACNGGSDSGVNFCCNANPDPCCEHDFCGGPMTSECAAERACMMDGGTLQWSTGGPICVSPDEAGSSAVLYADAVVLPPPAATPAPMRRWTQAMAAFSDSMARLSSTTRLRATTLRSRMTRLPRTEMRTTELPEPELTPYASAQVRFASEAWPLRAAEELRSARIFRALARAARLVGMSAPWPDRLDAAERDEVRHSRLCADVGERLGAPPPRYDAAAVRARLGALPDPMLRVAAPLLVEIAIGETISMYLFRAGRRRAVEPLTRRALTIILSDEVRHQRLGWTAFVALWPALDGDRRAAVQHQAALGLGVLEKQVALPAMRWLERRQPFDPAYGALGVLDPELRVEAFYEAIERLVLPRLSRVGLDGRYAWALRHRSRSP